MADSETDQEEMEEEIDEENNGDESEVSEVEEDEENDTRPSSRNTNKRSSTTGLSNHLKSKHNITKNQEKNQLTIHKVINNSEAIILGVTTNNASNNITFLQAVEDELSKKFIRFEILDPRLKLEYMKDNEWEKCWIDKTKNDVSEIYNTLYVPKEIQNTRIECNSSDEDLVSHISKRQRIESIGELDHYLKADRAQPLTNVLKWWKVSFI
ncbi:unnamed protein product [Rhizophagus irregularis]|nr:unnamed protein product [Rhizophagus irregularis]